MKARNSQRVRSLLEIQKALELYAADHNGLYPLPESTGVETGTYGLECWECNLDGNWNRDSGKLAAALSPYLNPRPSDPSFSTPFPDNGGFWYLVLFKELGQFTINRSGYKMVLYNTVELPRGANDGNDLIQLMRGQGIPDRMIDLQFDPGSLNPVISVASSDRAMGAANDYNNPGGSGVFSGE